MPTRILTPSASARDSLIHTASTHPCCVGKPKEVGRFTSCHHSKLGTRTPLLPSPPLPSPPASDAPCFSGIEGACWVTLGDSFGGGGYCFWGFWGCGDFATLALGSFAPHRWRWVLGMGSGDGEACPCLPLPALCPPGTPKSSHQSHSRVSQGGCAALYPAPGEAFSWLTPPSPPHRKVVGTHGSGQRPQPSPRVCSPFVRERQGCSPQHWHLGGYRLTPPSQQLGRSSEMGFPGMVLGGLEVGTAQQRRPHLGPAWLSRLPTSPPPWSVRARGPWPSPCPVPRCPPPVCNKHLSP